jgi:adenine-specific DNA methylase
VWKPFEALPYYFGGKRKLCPWIFREIARYIPEREWSGLAFLDPFAGGGSVSLYAKAQGMAVTCGDSADRSYTTLRALIVNNSTHLTDEDISTLIQPAQIADVAADVFARRRRTLNWFVTDEIADLVRTMLANLSLDADPDADRYWLRRYLLVRFVSFCSIYGQMRHNSGQRMIGYEYEIMTSTELRHLVMRWSQPLPFLMKVARPIDQAIFGNGYDHVAFLGDARDFLAEHAGRILYLDPPYPGTLSYEDAYWPIDCLLAGHMIPRVISRFSKREGWRYLADLLDLAQDVELWAISLGNAEIMLDDLIRLVEVFRPVTQAKMVKYAHLRNVASAEKITENREFLVMALKP